MLKMKKCCCLSSVLCTKINSFFKKNHPVRLAIGRAGNVIGGGDWSSHRIIPDCIKSVVKGKKVKKAKDI